MARTKRLAVWSVVIGTIVLGLKYLAYHLTGSIALYSDALESIVNVATAVATLFAVHVSAKPADAGHPFGHTKVEYFTAVIEGVLIVVAALSISAASVSGFPQPHATGCAAAGHGRQRRGERAQRPLVLGAHHRAASTALQRSLPMGVTCSPMY